MGKPKKLKLDWEPGYYVKCEQAQKQWFDDECIIRIASHNGVWIHAIVPSKYVNWRCPDGHNTDIWWCRVKKVIDYFNIGASYSDIFMCEVKGALLTPIYVDDNCMQMRVPLENVIEVVEPTKVKRKRTKKHG